MNRYAFPTVLCIGAIATLKDVLGIERIELDKHPLKNKIKQSMYYRKYNRFDEAIQVAFQLREFLTNITQAEGRYG